MRLALVAVLVLCAPLDAQSPDHLGKTLSEWQADLDSGSGIDRLLAIRSIGEMAVADRARAAEALFAAMSHADSSVRYWAAVAAVHLPKPYPTGAPVLRKALEDQVPEVRIQAALAQIGSGGGVEALETLGELLSHPNRGVRLHAVHAADSLGGKAAPLAGELRKALEDDFDYVQRVARHALWTLGERPCPYRECQ